MKFLITRKSDWTFEKFFGCGERNQVKFSKGKETNYFMGKESEKTAREAFYYGFKRVTLFKVYLAC